MRTAIVDRIPGESTAASVGKLDRPAWKVADKSKHTVKDSADGQKHYVLGPSAEEVTWLQTGVFEGSQKVRIKSELEKIKEQAENVE